MQNCQRDLITKMSEKDLLTRDAKRDIGRELLKSLRQMKAGEGKVIYLAAIEARNKVGMNQAQFAKLLGVSVRTLQGWEQGRIKPSGAARTLLEVARRSPEVLRDLAA